MNTQQTLLDADDAGAILLLSARRVRALARQGKLPHVVLPGGEIRFDPADLSRFVELHKRMAVVTEDEE
jgi:hypothetical protein